VQGFGSGGNAKGVVVVHPTSHESLQIALLQRLVKVLLDLLAGDLRRHLLNHGQAAPQKLFFRLQVAQHRQLGSRHRQFGLRLSQRLVGGGLAERRLGRNLGRLRFLFV